MIVCVIGGSGFLGQHVVPLLLEDPQVERIRILSRSEHVQAELKEKWSVRVDFLVGDVRDKERIKRALQGCDQVYHFAATKRVESCEYNPDEAISTNVTGTQNVINACLEANVEKAIFTSTDKAVEPLNVYGITKALAEKLWIAANIGKHRTRFAACRYGNVFGSKGSVIEKWRTGEVKVTNGGMTRFFISASDAAKFVISSMQIMDGGEVFIPKMRAAMMLSVAELFTENATLIPMRPGEKIHEKLVADAERSLVTDLGDRYIRWPEFGLFPVKKRGSETEDSFLSSTVDRLSFEELKWLKSSLT